MNGTVNNTTVSKEVNKERDALGRSLVKITKRRKQSTEPCGVPDLTGQDSENEWLT